MATAEVMRYTKLESASKSHWGENNVSNPPRHQRKELADTGNAVCVESCLKAVWNVDVDACYKLFDFRCQLWQPSTCF